MSEEKALSLIKRYERLPLLRALIQLVPLNVGGAAESMVLAQYNNLKSERTRTFFDQLASGQIALQTELLESDDFIHCFMATHEAARRTHQKEKIVSFANLLVGAVNQDKISGVDEYEEFLSIVEDMSVREFRLLSILFRHENTGPSATLENIQARAQSIWSSFKEEAHKSLGIADKELPGLLTRLTRTGCFEISTGTYIGYTGGLGYTTPLYARIRAFIVANSG